MGIQRKTWPRVSCVKDVRLGCSVWAGLQVVRLPHVQGVAQHQVAEPPQSVCHGVVGPFALQLVGRQPALLLFGQTHVLLSSCKQTNTLIIIIIWSSLLCGICDGVFACIHLNTLLGPGIKSGTFCFPCSQARISTDSAMAALAASNSRCYNAIWVAM